MLLIIGDNSGFKILGGCYSLFDVGVRNLLTLLRFANAAERNDCLLFGYYSGSVWVLVMLNNQQRRKYAGFCMGRAGKE
jgi:hypothetical protein